jgi:crotonobetainyl-CoA:carnitine CoA-transferase CaiB-like acyl-CoA transferase
MPGPLAGIRVVDASAIVSGPLATMMLADQGADVIKLEAPGIGDTMRIGPFRRGGLSAFFANTNRGKRSLVLDLRKPRALEIAKDLVRRADVFVQNWRPGAAERLGLGPEDLRAVKPDLIYASISGYGDSGPYRDRRVYDPIIQGLTGHVAVQRNPEFPVPDLVRNVIADKASAYVAAQAITAALFARDRGAGGQHLHVPMLDTSLAFFWPDGMMAHTMMGEGVEVGPTLYELYRLQPTADGHLIYFAVSDAEMHGLFRALGHAEWCADPRFGAIAGRRDPANFQALGGMLDEAFRGWKTHELLERLVAEQVAAGAVLSLEEVITDPQVRHNGAIVEREHPAGGRMREPRPAARFERTPAEPGRPAPMHGEHTDEILEELGIDAKERLALRSEGVIA